MARGFVGLGYSWKQRGRSFAKTFTADDYRDYPNKREGPIYDLKATSGTHTLSPP